MYTEPQRPAGKEQETAHSRRCTLTCMNQLCLCEEGLGHEGTGLDKVHASLMFNRSLDPRTTEGVKRQMIIQSRMAQIACAGSRGECTAQTTVPAGEEHAWLAVAPPAWQGLCERVNMIPLHVCVLPSFICVFPWCESTAPFWEAP